MARRNAFVNHTLAISLISEGSGGGTPPKGGYFILLQVQNPVFLSGGLQHFSRFLMQVHGFTGGTCGVFDLFCALSRVLSGDLQHFSGILLQVLKRGAVLTQEGFRP